MRQDRRMRFVLAAAFAAAVLGSLPGPPTGAQDRPMRSPTAVDRVAEGYVTLVLALGVHDADYVDAYYGPPAWRDEAAAAKVGLDAIGVRAAALLTELKGAPAGSDELSRLRHEYLEKQLSALAARVRLLKGERLSF